MVDISISVLIGLGLLIFVGAMLIGIDRKLNVGNQYLEAILKALSAPPPEGDEEPAPEPTRKKKRAVS